MALAKAMMSKNNNIAANTSTSTQQEMSRLQEMIDARNIKTERAIKAQPFVRPKLASTIVIIDDEGPSPRVLMGQRNKALKFMPGALVFPGGRVDRGDYTVKAADALDCCVETVLNSTFAKSASKNTARALGVAAIRELFEETGLIIGEPSHEQLTHRDWQAFSSKGMIPKINSLRILGRAITPPGNVRRFDTWFFIARKQAISFTPDNQFDPSGELEELRWIEPEAALGEQTREITRIFLLELMNRLKIDPDLSANAKVPFYRYRAGNFIRSLI